MALGELKNGIGLDAYAIYQQVLAAVVERDHPVGSLYMSENSTSPAELYGGTWERIKDCTIWGASDTHPAGTMVEAGLPDIEGAFALLGQYGAFIKSGYVTGCFRLGDSANVCVPQGQTETNTGSIVFRASRSNSIYGASATVQPPAYSMYIWRRVA